MEQETLRQQLRQQLQAFLEAALPAHCDDLLLIFDSGEIHGQRVVEIAKFREFEEKLPRPWSSRNKPEVELQRDCDYMLRVGRMAVFAALRFLEHAHEFDEQATEAWLHELPVRSAEDGGQDGENTSPSSKRKRKPKSELPVHDVLRQFREETLLYTQLISAVAESVRPKGLMQPTIDGCRVLCGQFLHPELTPNDDGRFNRFPCTTPGGGGAPLNRVGEAIYRESTGDKLVTRQKRSEGGKRTNRPKQQQLQPFTRPTPVQPATLEEQQFVASPIEQQQHQPYIPPVPVEAGFCFNQVPPPAYGQSLDQLLDRALEAIKQLATFQHHQQHMSPPNQALFFAPGMAAAPYPVMAPFPPDEVSNQDELDGNLPLDEALLQEAQNDPLLYEALMSCDSRPNDRDSLQQPTLDEELNCWSSIFDFAEDETSHDETLSARSSRSPPSSPSSSSLGSDGSTSPTPFADFPDNHPAKRARLGHPDVFEMSFPVLSLP